jgi:hypothetical protein
MVWQNMLLAVLEQAVVLINGTLVRSLTIMEAARR